MVEERPFCADNTGVGEDEETGESASFRLGKKGDDVEEEESMGTGEEEL